MPLRTLAAPLAAAALAGCTAYHSGPVAAMPLPATPVSSPAQWRAFVTRDDRRRIDNWRKDWVKALAKARPGHPAQITAEGPLLDPDAALSDPAPPPGDYRCRTIKLGALNAGAPDYVLYPAARCRIERSGGGTLVFIKSGGTQRPAGRIFVESSRRMIFLGTLQLGDEEGTLRYGHDKARDLAALVERVGPHRWRLAFPSPHFESKLDVIELVPAG
jgi:hypothetical protein